ncbi:hypothetical protein [Nonomuraea dietziae]|uniref:hypothetical protein n=1 Tax=Nonomuraea dietziae TaxID=65515 RepID=UPI003418989D
MATIPAPRTWTVGELLSASKLNIDLRNAINFLLAPPLAQLKRGASQSIPNAVATPVTLTEAADTDNGFDLAAPSRYVAKTAGWFDCDLNFSWRSVGTDLRQANITVNGVGRFGIDSIHLPRVSTSNVVFLAVNDYVEFSAYQASGAAQDLRDVTLTYCWKSV